ncbi:MAG: chemotaxis protein CheB [Sporichthyaceae bacterium]
MRRPSGPGAAGPVRVLAACGSPTRTRQIVAAFAAGAKARIVGLVLSDRQIPEAVARYEPAFVLVDLELPGDPIAAIAALMATRPTPTVALAGPGVEASRRADALAAGALEVWTEQDLGNAAARTAVLAGVTVVRRQALRPASTEPVSAQATPTPARSAASSGSHAVVAVGASTGGPPALSVLLDALGQIAASVLIVQHIEAGFVARLAEQLAAAAHMPVTVAEAEILAPGHVYLAPAGSHLRLGAGGRLELSPTPQTLHTPSIDELFRSLAPRADLRRIGVLLTGMGRDGAQGLAAMRASGARTIAQDEESSAVYGMPRAAAELNAAERVLPLSSIAAAIRGLLEADRALR